MHVFNQGRVSAKAKLTPARFVSKRRALLTTTQVTELRKRQSVRSHRVALREWAAENKLTRQQMLQFEISNIRLGSPKMDPVMVLKLARKNIEDAFGK